MDDEEFAKSFLIEAEADLLVDDGKDYTTISLYNNVVDYLGDYLRTIRKAEQALNNAIACAARVPDVELMSILMTNAQFFNRAYTEKTDGAYMMAARKRDEHEADSTS